MADWKDIWLHRRAIDAESVMCGGKYAILHASQLRPGFSC